MPPASTSASVPSSPAASGTPAAISLARSRDDAAEVDIAGSYVAVFSTGATLSNALALCFTAGPSHVRLHPRLATSGYGWARTSGAPVATSNSAAVAVSPEDSGAPPSAASAAAAAAAAPSASASNGAREFPAASAAADAFADPAMSPHPWLRRAVSISEVATKGMDAMSIRESAAGADPFVPKALPLPTKLIMMVQAAVSVYCGAYLAWNYVVGGSAGSRVANVKLAGLMAMTMCLPLALPLLHRFYVRGSYHWLIRRAFAEGTVRDLQRFWRWTGGFGYICVFDSVLLLLTAPSLFLVNMGNGKGGTPWSHDWWSFQYSFGPVFLVACQFMWCIGPLLGMNVAFETLFAARLKWLRSSCKTRVQAMAVYYEMQNVLLVMSAEVQPMVVVLLLFGLGDLLLMSLFLASEHIVAWGPVITIPACGSMMAITVLTLARVSHMAHKFTRDFVMVMDSLPDPRLVMDGGDWATVVSETRRITASAGVSPRGAVSIGDGGSADDRDGGAAGGATGSEAGEAIDSHGGATGVTVEAAPGSAHASPSDAEVAVAAAAIVAAEARAAAGATTDGLEGGAAVATSGGANESESAGRRGDAVPVAAGRDDSDDVHVFQHVTDLGTDVAVDAGRGAEGKAMHRRRRRRSSDRAGTQGRGSLTGLQGESDYRTPSTLDGFYFDVSEFPLGIRLWGSLVKAPRELDAYRSISLLMGAVFLLIRSTITTTLAEDAGNLVCAPCVCEAAPAAGNA